MVVWADKLADLWGLRCARGEGCPGPCDAQGGDYLGVAWSRCPWREVMDDARLRYTCQVDREAEIAPLADWPDGWAAWVPDMVGRLRAGRAARVRGDG